MTEKQELFCNLYIELGNGGKAYRESYNVKESTKDDTCNNNAYKLLQNNEIITRIEFLRKGIAERNKISKDDILKGHKKIVEAWEELWELGKKDPLSSNETKRFYLLKEMVKGSDYRGAWQEISKLTGAYSPEKVEKDIKIEIVEKKRS